VRATCRLLATKQMAVARAGLLVLSLLLACTALQVSEAGEGCGQQGSARRVSTVARVVWAEDAVLEGLSRYSIVLLRRPEENDTKGVDIVATNDRWDLPLGSRQEVVLVRHLGEWHIQKASPLEGEPQEPEAVFREPLSQLQKALRNIDQGSLSEEEALTFGSLRFVRTSEPLFAPRLRLVSAWLKSLPPKKRPSSISKARLLSLRLMARRSVEQASKALDAVLESLILARRSDREADE